MFEITAAGVIMGAAGIAYLLLAGRWLLPDRDILANILPSTKDRHFLADVLAPLGSPLVGKKLKDAGLTENQGFWVIDVIRNDVSQRWKVNELELRAGDRIVIRSKAGDMLGLREAGDVAFEAETGHAFEPIGASETVLMEGIVGPHSRLIGRRLAELNLRRL